MHQIDPRLGGLAYLVSKVFIVPVYRCKGVFRSLWNEVNDIAKNDQNAKIIRMVVFDTNEQACKVYDRCNCDRLDWSF